MSTVVFDNDVFTRWDNNRGLFELTQPLGVKWLNDDGIIIIEFVVPAGFLTDFASIPRWATPIIPKLGRDLRSSVAHDYLYEFNLGLTRIQVDDLFFDGMVADGVSVARRHIMYQAVRIGGENLFDPESNKPNFEEFDND